MSPHHVIELRLDEAARALVREAWSEIARAGIGDAMPRSGAAPHVSLLVGTIASLDGVERALRPIAAATAPLDLAFPYLGVFRGAADVGFLGVAPSPALTRLHAEVHRAVAPHCSRVHEHYRPAVAVPHCTLALEIPPSRLPDYLDIVRRARLPEGATVEGIDVVEYFPGRVLASLPLGAEDGA